MTNYIKVLHIAECAGGVDKYLSMLMPLLKKNNIQQCFICSQNYDSEKYKLWNEGVFPINMNQSFNPINLWKNIKKIRNILKQTKPDIIYCHSSFAGGLGRIASIGLNCKIIYNPHGWAFNIISAKRYIYLFIEKILELITDKIVCISEAEKTSAINKHITSSQKLELIPNGIDITTVQNAVPKSRESLGIPKDSYVIGMIGRLSPQKAPDIFIKAVNQIKKEIPNIHCIIVGDGELKPEIQQYAKQHSIPLLITGWTNEAYSYLKIFDIALLLSRWEGFGLAIAEYMAANKNFIATNVDAIPTLVENNIDGLLVNPDSPEEVKEKILYLYTHPFEAENMRKKALQKVKEKYEIHRVAYQHIDLFKQLIKEKKSITEKYN